MAHDDPIRLRVLKAISDALKEITPANGYKSDMAAGGPKTKYGRVIRGRSTFGDNDPLPMLTILEVPQPIEQIRSSRENPNTAGDWELIIQGFVEDDSANPTDPAHYLMADVKKRLAVEKKKMQRGLDTHLFGIKAISDIQLGSGVVRPPDEGSAKAYFWLSVVLSLVEDSADPYS